MEWIKDVILACPKDVIGIVVISSFAIFLMFKLIVWAFKIIEKFSDSETEMSKSISELKGLIEVWLKE